MFHKHLERQQLKGRECFCVLASPYSKQNEQNRCFLIKHKTEVSQICPDSSSVLVEDKKRIKLWRKHSLKLNQKENENTCNIQGQSCYVKLGGQPAKNKWIHQQLPKRLIKFTYQAQPLSSSYNYHKQLPVHCPRKELQSINANLVKIDIQSSTNVSHQINSTNRQDLRAGQKISIFELKKRLVTHSSDNNQITSKETAIKPIKARAYSTASLHQPRQFKFNPVQFASVQTSHLKLIKQQDPPAKGDLVKLNQLCFKRAESIGESEEDHISEVQSNPSLILTEKDDFEPNWNFSLKQILQRRKQRVNPQYL